MQSNRKGLKFIARSSFIDGLAERASRLGSVVVTLKPTGIKPQELVGHMVERGLKASIDGLTVQIARPKQAA